MMDMDPNTKYLYVDHGGVDSNRGPGALAIVDSNTWEKVGEVPTEYRPAALQIETHGDRLFVLVPGLSQVAVVSRTNNQDLRAIPVSRTCSAHRPHARREPNHRLFVVNRRPSSFNVLDMETGRPIETLDTIDGVESMYLDAKLHRLYLTALDGYLQVIQQIDADHYRTIARFFTGHHAGTSQFVPNLNLLCVAVPPVEGQAAEIWLFQPKP